MIAADENVTALIDYLAQYEIGCDTDKALCMLRHLDLVVEKNKVMNLTRITDPTDALIRHIVDSLLLVPSFRKNIENEQPRFLDIGTGAGFPGIPLGIYFAHKGLLIDSVGKKAHAVQEFIEELGLEQGLKAEAIRAEELAKREPQSFDIVTARAVADLGPLVEYASPLLVKRGRLIVSKARVSDDEVLRGVETGKIVGLSLVSRETYELPEEMGHREILTFLKDKKSRIKLPRQTGQALHKPLVS